MSEDDKYATVDLNVVRMRIAELRALRAASGPVKTRTRATRTEGGAKPSPKRMSAETKAVFEAWRREKDARENVHKERDVGADLENGSPRNS